LKLFVGTSGFSYKEWKGSFYPKDLPAGEMLRYYAERFQSVEINNTFYRMPKPEVLKGWAAEVPDGFTFVLKASQRITHFKRLKDAGEPLAYLLKVAASLGDHLGPLLFQLPPNMKSDVARLRDFLEQIPRGTRAALEFRHASWFDDEVFALMRDHAAALCIAEAEDGVEVPFVSTADWGYLRLRMGDYSAAQMRKWLKQMEEQRWREAFVFFKHEDEGKAPRFANEFVKIAGGHKRGGSTGSRVRAPKSSLE
jgi:uncharacterized protein YecE (DUF72 family)